MKHSRLGDWLVVLTTHSILSVNPVLPQAQFLELMVQQFCSVCLASAVTLLQLYCVLKAREHTSPPAPRSPLPLPTAPPPPVPYNSSASAVTAIWLVLLIFMVCYVRSAGPQLLLPSINFTVVVVVTSSLAPTLPTMSVAITFAKQLLVINLTGLSVSLAVNMLVWPTTNRQSFKHDVREWQKCVERCLAARTVAIYEGLRTDLEAKAETEEKGDGPTPILAELATDIASPMQELLAVVDKMKTNLRFSQREMSIGKLSPTDLSKINDLIYGVLQPIMGLISGTRVRELVAEIDLHAHRHLLLDEHEKASEVQDFLVEILQDALRTLKLIPRKPGMEVPHGISSLLALKERLRLLHGSRHARIEAWQREFRPRKDYNESEQSLLFLALNARLPMVCSA